MSIQDKLIKNKTHLKVLEDSLKEYIYTNRGRRTTAHSDERLLEIVECIGMANYNIGYCTNMLESK